ncbi:hypothetical protein [Aquimarina longa]|uniref:hypothetical protein n=1 Tax=Aquimarina longa TaxID=1080221 RepID=UPI0007848EAC|nr:hypothetical protein [Aquimarina longa]
MVIYKQISTIGVLLLVIGLCISCKEHSFSKGAKAQITTKEQFWKNRTGIQNKEIQEKTFPIPIDTAITEERTNRIYINSGQCQYEVFVDDVLLLKLMGPITARRGGMTGDHDINQLLLTSGTHEIKVRMYPRYGVEVFPKGEGQMKLTFSHFRDRNLKTVTYNNQMNGHNGIVINQSDKQWITKYSEEHQEEYDGDYEPKTPNKLEGLPIYEWRSTFDAEVPFSYTGWRSSIDLRAAYKDKEKEIQKEVLETYRAMHKIIKNRDVNGYLALVREREELITSCLLYKTNEKTLRQKEFVDLIQNNAYEVQPLVSETFKIEFQGYGKLVMLLHKVDGEGVIRLQNKKDPKDMIYLDFRLQRKTKGDPLTVI